MVNQTLVALLNRVNSGNPDAVTELITGYYPMMYKTALGITGDSNDAQDVVQDASIKLIRNITQLDNVNAFEPWVKRIVRNEALDYMKTAYQRHNVMWTDMSSSTDEGELEYDPADEKIAFQPEMAYDEKVRQEIILKVLNDLPVDQRTVIQMYFYDGMKLQEIADELNVPLSTVTGRLQKAKTRVKTSVTELQKRDGIKLYGLSPLPFFLYLLGWWKGTGPVPVPPASVYPGTVRAAAQGMKAAGAKAAVKTAAGVTAKAAVPMAVKIGLGAAVVVGAVFGGSRIASTMNSRQENGSTSAVSTNIKDDHEQTGNANDDNDSSEGTISNREEPQYVIWHVQPVIHFDNVVPLMPLYANLTHYAEGYPQDWVSDTNYTNDAILGVVDGKEGIWNYEGEVLFEPSINSVNEQYDPAQPYKDREAVMSKYDRDDSQISYRQDVGYRSLYGPDMSMSSYYFSEDFRTMIDCPKEGCPFSVHNEHLKQASNRRSVSGPIAVQNGVIGYICEGFEDLGVSDEYWKQYNIIPVVNDELKIIGYNVYSQNREVLYSFNTMLDCKGGHRLMPDVINGYFTVNDIPCDGTYEFGERHGIWLSGRDWKNDRDTYCAVVKASTGEYITDFIYERTLYFEDGYMPVMRDGKWGFIDETGTEVTDFIFDDVSGIYHGLVYVGIDGTYGVLDLAQTLEAGIPVTMESCYGQ